MNAGNGQGGMGNQKGSPNGGMGPGDVAGAGGKAPELSTDVAEKDVKLRRNCSFEYIVLFYRIELLLSFFLIFEHQ